MATINSDQSNHIEDEFIEAKNNWELEKLYIDLASAKGKALTPVEKKFLRGLLCGCSPAEIASKVYQSRSSSTVRVYLSNGLYKYIEEMLSNQAGHSVKVKSWSRVTHLLEKAGYKKVWLGVQSAIASLNTNRGIEIDLVTNTSNQLQDWGEAIDISLFSGRTKELAVVGSWIVQERCRLVVLLGMGGIGKTAFSVKLAEEIKDNFAYIVWRSLRLAPPLEVILDQIIQVLSPQSEAKKAVTLDDKLSYLIDCLRSCRCLIVLDHVDAILCSNDENESLKYLTPTANNLEIKNTFTNSLSQICYHQGYEMYGELIRRIGDSQHQSCLVLTSREKPPDITAMEGKVLPVRSCKLTGLNQIEIIPIIKAKGFSNLKTEEYKLFTELYAGNPLLIKLAATTIQELFSGNIHEFLEQGNIIFGDIRAILDQQFARLSDLEKQIMYWIALQPDFVAVEKLQQDILPGLSKQFSPRLILEAIELLQKRSLIEKQASGFTQTPVLKEYLIERLIEENFKLSEQKQGHLLMSQTIFATQLKKYIQENRLRK
ncbi:MAG: NB-ARC domain-containing protein [Desmonostoc vinosum HA7617-LM4]|jgi:hypothetical protein|nr:NB-ARC domain-containing protein [Desmonostoc vinosum HA7617-LM4]